jgi:hypothetical protein
MAATTWSVDACASTLSVIINCLREKYSATDIQYKEPNGDSTLEIELDISELSELRYMAVRPHVREVINDLVTKLTREAAALKISDGTINTSKPTSSEIVAGVKSSHVEVQHSNIHKIPIVTTTQVCKVPKFLNVVNNQEIRNQIRTINPVNQNKLKPSKEKHKIILIGDSHARRCTGKLQENLQDQFEVLGYDKPGAGVSLLTKTVLQEVA